MFLRNLARGEAYSAEAPTLWDVDYQTAVAQAEMEDRELPGAYHRLRFDDIEIDTTRPELLAACVAWWPTPTTSASPPASAPRCTRRSSGSRCRSGPPAGRSREGIGHRHDLHLRRRHRRRLVARADLPTRSIVTRDGPHHRRPPPGVRRPGLASHRRQTVKAAQRAMVELLTESGDLIGEPRPITHPVKFYERATGRSRS
jgi:valyl-tRNA synthetase